MARAPLPPEPPSNSREASGPRRARWQVRGGGKASRREDDELSDSLLDRSAGRRNRSAWGRSRRAQMIASIRGGGLFGFLPRSPVARMLLGIIAVILLLLVMASARAATGKDGFVAVPPYAARVTDQVSMLTAAQRSALEGVLADYEARSGSQIAVLLLSSTAPESIEQYSIRVAEAWKLGRKGVDDGVLLLVAKDNPSGLRRLRIEAGRGVQGSLTDAQSKRVLQDVIAPHFRQNDYYGGLAAGVSAIATLIDKEHLPAPAGAAGRAATQTQPGAAAGAPQGASASSAGSQRDAGAASDVGAGNAAGAGVGKMADAAGAGAIDGATSASAPVRGAAESTASGSNGATGGRGAAAGGNANGSGSGSGSGHGGGAGIGWFFPMVLILAGFFLMRSSGRRGRALRQGGWGSDASGVLLGAALGHAMSNAGRGWGQAGYGGGFGSSSSGSFGGGGFSGGGGGTFDGGGASGDW